MKKAEIATNIMERLYNYPSKQDYHKIIQGLNDEIISLQNDRKDLVDGYIELHSMLNRKQRSRIAIISMGLRYLLGISTQSDSGTICINVDKLANNQKEIAHVVDDSISVTYVT